MNIRELTKEIENLGYKDENASARVCQDIILKAISKSTLSRNATIKGGVVMRSMTNNIRRATQDMDIDFIRYSLSDDSIDMFVKKIDCLDGITIKRIGKILELNQQDYHGKRVFVEISDEEGNSVESKIDLGVHKRLEITQEEYCFDIVFDEEGASLLINSKEQMIAEKIRSLLKFGRFSTRYKDIFDIYYFCEKVDAEKFKCCMKHIVFSDSKMRENNMDDVYKRISNIFKDKVYKSAVDKSDKRWLDEDIDTIFDGILEFIGSIS
ncbi:MAG: nucleotidyl transferase AbiEii/AbiGii toxin family protein [Erysipelotrichaceae bacterium]|nr:nucleotidyl transferase AbiEii/AbiGii toxin family protein [Erysipelotrichaceae bacterium]